MAEHLQSGKKRILYRLVITFLIAIIPVYFIGIGIYSWGVGTIRRQITNSMVTQLEYYLRDLETEVQRIKLLQFDCLNDQSLNHLSFGPESLSEYDKARAILLVQQRLFAIRNSSGYIREVRAYIPAINTIVLSSRGVYETLLDKPDTTAVKRTTRSSQLTYVNGELYSNLTFPFSYSSQSGKGRYFTVEIEFSKENFQQAIHQFDKYPDSFTLLYNPYLELTYKTGFSDEAAEKLHHQPNIDIYNKKSGDFSLGINGRKYLGVHAFSKYLGMTLVNYIPEDAIYLSLTGYQIWFWLLSCACIVIILLYSTSTYRSIYKPLSVMVKAFKKVEGGDLKVSIEHNQEDEFGYLYHRFNAMVVYIDNLIEQAYKQRILVQHSELKQLQSQINPHFLYNTFFTLYSMAKADDNENLMKFLLQLGSYFQFITRSAADEVPLYRELEHARTYTEIQVLRFSNRIQAEFEDLPAKYADVTVPRLIVQPIIENAFKYGLEEKKKNGKLWVYFVPSPGMLGIVVEDNGGYMKWETIESMRRTLVDEYDGETTAMVNIHRRLKLMYGPGSGLIVTLGESGGLKAIINIILKEDGNVSTVDMR